MLTKSQPAGVGIGKKPPIFLQPGDEVAVSVTGMGTLRNKIAQTSAENAIVNRVITNSSFTYNNAGKSIGANVGLMQINGKPLHYQTLGLTESREQVVFVHGLGGTMDYWTPLISKLSIAESHKLHLFDLEGHGLSPTHPLSDITIESLASDIRGVFDHAQISALNPGTLVAHSLGCLAALRFALDNSELVKRLVLIGVPSSPIPDAVVQGSLARAALARTKGMAAVVDAVATAGTSEYSKKNRPVSVTAVRLSLLGQDPESYAKACAALARATQELTVEALSMPTLIVTGDEDKVSPPELCETYSRKIKGSRLRVIKNCGHWHVFEDVNEVAQAMNGFI